MRLSIVPVLLLLGATPAPAQIPTHDITATELQRIIGQPLSQAVEQRQTFKAPVRAVYGRQMAMVGKDCEAESKQGQQPYNLCMGHADEQAVQDFATFYNNLQMLCHDQGQLTTLQASEKVWLSYQNSAMQAEHAAWPDGTGASGFAGQVHLSLLRDRMRELDEIYGLNIAQ